MAHFTKVYLNIPNLHPVVAMHALIVGLKPDLFPFLLATSMATREVAASTARGVSAVCSTILTEGATNCSNISPETEKDSALEEEE